MAEPQPGEDLYPIDQAVDEAISACDGDVRATIRSLIIANSLLEQEIAELTEFWCSYGFHRGKLRIRDLP